MRKDMAKKKLEHWKKMRKEKREKYAKLRKEDEMYYRYKSGRGEEGIANILVDLFFIAKYFFRMLLSLVQSANGNDDLKDEMATAMNKIKGLQHFPSPFVFFGEFNAELQVPWARKREEEEEEEAIGTRGSAPRLATPPTAPASATSSWGTGS